MEEKIKIVECFCLWEDLLGFGQPLYDYNWDVTNENVLKNIMRLKLLEQETLNISSVFLEKVFTLNDGFIRNFDIPTNDIFVLLSWIEDTLIGFERLNVADKSNGFYGVRGVLTYGQRVVYTTKEVVGLGEYIQTSAEQKNIYNETNVVNAPAELQMNTAFSKAYIMEAGGSKMGLHGNQIFIDIKVIEKLAELINTIKSREIYTTVDDASTEPLFYFFEAMIDLSSTAPCFSVQARTSLSQTAWECFRINFLPSVEYSNEQQSLNTNLLIPKSMFSGYTSPYEDYHSTHDFVCVV